jgi:putative hydrolase of the HAD superfamily
MKANSLIIFDAFGTLVTTRRGHEGTFSAGLSRIGIDASEDVLSGLQTASHGLDHSIWSGSRSDYMQWTTATLRTIEYDGIKAHPELTPCIIPALEQLYQAPIIALPEAQACLETLKAADLIVAVCSNWGWDLREDLAATGLLPNIDLLITSAQNGYRKPHSQIYRATLAAAGFTAGQAVFIGDSVQTDVLGPQRIGIRSILLRRRAAEQFSGERMNSLAEVTRLLSE